MLQVSDYESVCEPKGGLEEQRRNNLLMKPARQSPTLTNLLIISRLEPGSGNLSTANRLRNYLVGADYACNMEDVEQFLDAADFRRYLLEKRVAMVIGIHAYRAGQLLCGCPLPYAIVFGGTDLNVFSEQPSKLAVMTEVVKEASLLVAFGPSLRETALSIWPLIDRERLWEISQGVVTDPSPRPQFDIKSQFQMECEEPLLFTLVAGIRPVKDPLYLVQAFSEWHQSEACGAYLVILGSLMDEDFREKFLQAIDGCPGILYVGFLPIPEAHALIQRSFAVVNTSLSEGMCTAILEAQQLGIPVLARDILANKILVKDGETGLLFSSPQQFIRKAQQLMKDAKLRSKLTKNGKHTIHEHFNCEKERQSYLSLVKTVLGGVSRKQDFE